jgi:K+-transporting ATPase KdpF subunit
MGICGTVRKTGKINLRERGLSCLRCASIKIEETQMNLLYLISGAIALVLFVYLFVALLKPEKFS